MSISFSGTCTRSGGITSAIAKQLKSFSLKPVKRISYKFDPFQTHEARSIRWCMFYLSTAKIRDTNIRCTFKTEVVCDQSEPLMQVNLENGKQIVFKTANLSELEIIEKYNELIGPLVPKEDDLSSKIPAKLAKKTIGGGGAGGKPARSAPKKK